MGLVRFGSLSIFALTAACVVQTQAETVFWREGIGFSARQSDFTSCEVASLQQVPRAIATAQTPIVTTPQTIFSPATTRCYGAGNTVNCTTTPAIVAGGQTSGGQIFSYDANSDLRQRVVEQCMASKGYQLVTLPPCTRLEAESGQVLSQAAPLPNAKFASCFLPSPFRVVVLPPA